MNRLKHWLIPLAMMALACGANPTDDGSTGLVEVPAAMADDAGPSWLLGPHPVSGSTVLTPDTLAFGVAWSLLVDSESVVSMPLGVIVLLDGRDVSNDAIIMVTRDYPPSSYTVLVPFDVRPGDHQVLVKVMAGESVIDSTSWRFAVE
jgi:hypothetical protein